MAETDVSALGDGHIHRPCVRQQRRAHLAHASDDRRNLGETVRAVPRELLGRRVACGAYIWWGKAVGLAWEFVEAHEARGPVQYVYAVVDVVAAANV